MESLNRMAIELVDEPVEAGEEHGEADHDLEEAVAAAQRRDDRHGGRAVGDARGVAGETDFRPSTPPPAA